jgi:flagellar FliL protein
MADEDTEVEGKKKSPIVKIIVIVLLVLILLAGTVAGTLFFAGAFDAKDEQTAEEQLASLEEKAAADKAAAAAANAPGAPGAAGADPSRVRKDSPELTRFVQTYKEIEREFLANLTNSRKVIQVQIAIMTTYDDRVFTNVDKHEFALRSAALDVLRQVTEEQLASPTFRKDLAEKIRTEMNAVLENFEDFGGIEELYFTNFVIQ